MEPIMTIKDKVTTNIELLATFNHIQLRDWAKANGMDSAPGFARFKTALKTNGIDYAALRQASRAIDQAKTEALCTHQVTFYSDAKAKNDRFAICDKGGEPVWHGQFFDDRNYNGEQSSGEMAAALKAVWLASKVKEALGAETLKLILKVDAEWLCWANDTDGKGGKAVKLAQEAKRFGLLLEIEHVYGTQNPADHYTLEKKGFKKWQDNDLVNLAEPLTVNE
jgi:hypothetical protein